MRRVFFVSFVDWCTKTVASQLQKNFILSHYTVHVTTGIKRFVSCYSFYYVNILSIQQFDFAGVSRWLFKFRIYIVVLLSSVVSYMWFVVRSNKAFVRKMSYVREDWAKCDTGKRVALTIFFNFVLETQRFFHQLISYDHVN